MWCAEIWHVVLVFRLFVLLAIHWGVRESQHRYVLSIFYVVDTVPGPRGPQLFYSYLKAWTVNVKCLSEKELLERA